MSDRWKLETEWWGVGKIKLVKPIKGEPSHHGWAWPPRVELFPGVMGTTPQQAKSEAVKLTTVSWRSMHRMGFRAVKLMVDCKINTGQFVPSTTGWSIETP